MKRYIKYILVIFCLSSFLSGGCARLLEFFDPRPFMGINVKDLKKACAEGKKKVFAMSYDTAFEKTEDILKSHGLTVFQSNRRKGYIVTMGFQKQVDTTRVGVFFESLDKNKTKITLSSLSSSALEKAEEIIFEKLK